MDRYEAALDGPSGPKLVRLLSGERGEKAADLSFGPVETPYITLDLGLQLRVLSRMTSGAGAFLRASARAGSSMVTQWRLPSDRGFGGSGFVASRRTNDGATRRCRRRWCRKV